MDAELKARFIPSGPSDWPPSNLAWKPNPPRRGRKQESRSGLFYRALWAVLLHFIFIVALSATMIWLVDGYKAADALSPRSVHGKFRLRASDVTMLVSFALVLIKILVGVWTGTVVWNCVFMLLQVQGLALSEVGRIISLYVPPTPRHPVSWVAVVLLLLVVPQQLVAPLLSGSVGWSPGLERGVVERVSSGSSEARADWWWYYVMRSGDRVPTLKNAAAFANIAWVGASPDRRHCRHFMSESRAPVNSIVLNATIPCIEIHSITWPDDSPSEEVKNITRNSVRVSRVDSGPFTFAWPGNAIIFDPSNLERKSPPSDNNNQHTDYPEPFLQSGEMLVVMQIREQAPRSKCAELQSNIFSLPVSPGPGVWTAGDDGQYETCYTHAIVNFTAGVAISPKSTYISDRVIEADQPDRAMIIQKGSWVLEAIYLLPDVMSTISADTAASMVTRGNRTSYIDSLLRRSYQGAWDALAWEFDERLLKPEHDLDVYTQERVLFASVERAQVLAWLAIGLLVPLSAALLMVVPARFQIREVVIDGPAAALLTDPKAVLAKDRRDLTNLSYVTGEESADNLGGLRLEADGNATGREGYVLVRADEKLLDKFKHPLIGTPGHRHKLCFFSVLDS